MLTRLIENRLICGSFKDKNNAFIGAGAELGPGFYGSQHNRHCAVMKESFRKFLFSICNRAKATTVHVLQYNTV